MAFKRQEIHFSPSGTLQSRAELAYESLNITSILQVIKKLFYFSNNFVENWFYKI